jgi:hypothetical protein
MPKGPFVVVFDIDGTLAKVDDGTPESEIYNLTRLLSLKPWPNTMELLKRYMMMPNANITLCTGRPKSVAPATWRWLDKHLNLTGSGKSVTLSCRPDDVPESRIPAWKLSTVVQAIRRIGSKPSEALIFDDDLRNLQMFETLRDSVRVLKLFKVQDGVVSPWNL